MKIQIKEVCETIKDTTADLKEIFYALETITKYHNKNLTKEQYFALDDCVESLKLVIDRTHHLYRGIKNSK